MSETRLRKLKTLLEIANRGKMHEEFLKSLKKIMHHVLTVEKRIIERVDSKTQEKKENLEQLAQEFNKVIIDAKKESDSTLGGFKKRTIEAINKLFIRNEVNKKLKERLVKANEIIIKVDKRVASIKDGIDGQDGTNGIDGVDGKNGIDGQDGKGADDNKILKKLIKRVPKEDKSELKALREEVKVLRRMKRGGGTSAMGVAQAFKWILKTEKPSGAINGSNTTYTVDHVIFAVLAFSLNGEVIMEIPNYTISNKTITFSTALPAAYSNRDFEIKYI